MRVIDRLFQYIEQKSIAPYTFERTCGIANGYLKKQARGRGSVGSEILEKIQDKYSDLSLIWLITGKGPMLNDPGYAIPPESGQDKYFIKDGKPVYLADEGAWRLLREKITILENSLADKEKIIRLIEAQQQKP